MSYLGDVAAIVTAIAWSYSVILFSQAGLGLSTLQLNIFKNTVALIGFSLTMLIAGYAWLPDLATTQWWQILLSGLIGVAIGDLCFIASLRKLGAGFQAIVDIVYSPLVVILAAVMYAESLSTISAVGGSLVVSAIFVGAHRGHQQFDRQIWLGILLGVIAQACTAYAVLMIRPALQEQPLLWVVCMRFAAGQAALLIGTKIFCARGTISGALRAGFANHRALAASALGSYLTALLWVLGFKYTLAGRAAIYNQLATIFIILLSAWILKEPLTRRRIFAVILGLSGALVLSLG